jgi:hypothetical protein
MFVPFPGSPSRCHHMKRYYALIDLLLYITP